MSLIEEEDKRGAGFCECGSGITRVVMTWSALCSPALLSPSTKALCQESCLAMAWPPFCSTNSWIWLTEPFKHDSLHVPRNFPDKSSPYPEAIIFLLDFSPVSVCCLTPLQSQFHKAGELGSIFLRCKPGHPVLRQHSGHSESFPLPAFLHLQLSARQSPWKYHLHPVEISVRIWGKLCREREVEVLFLSCVSEILLLGIYSKEIIGENLVTVAGSYWALTVCQLVK